jgi:hypothetical protein
MMKWILLLLLISTAIFAAGPRKVDMSWPAVQGADAYEFKLIKVIDGDDKTVSVDKLDSPKWAKEVSPGVYKFQIRSLDYRSVPGVWSASQSFVVSLPTVKQISPILNQSFHLKKDQETSVSFIWEEITDAQRYHFILKSDSGEMIQNDTIEENSVSYELETANKYWWKVTALTAKDKIPKKIKYKRYFKLLSPPLEAPQAHFKVTKSHVLIKWEEDEKAVKDKVQIYRRVKEKWKKIMQKTLVDSNTIGFKKDTIKKGKYKLRLVAYTEDNQPSEPAIVYFNWDADTITDIEKEKKVLPIADDEWSNSPFFIGAGFSALSLNYESFFQSSNLNIVDTLTGIGFYFTLDYFFSDKRYIEADITLLNVVTNTTDWNFMDLDIFYNWKFSKNKQSSYTLFAGLFMNQEPLILINAGGGNSFNRTDFTTMGVNFGGKYHYHVTDRWNIGAILKLHLNLSFSALPDNFALEPSLSIFPSVTSEYALTKSIKVGSILNVILESFSADDGSTIEITGTSLEFFLTLDI